MSDRKKVTTRFRACQIFTFSFEMEEETKNVGKTE